METRLVWNIIGNGEVRRREEYLTTLQSGNPLKVLYHSKENKDQGVGFHKMVKFQNTIALLDTQTNIINPPNVINNIMPTPTPHFPVQNTERLQIASNNTSSIVQHQS